ncbi:Hsp90 chaperone protein kinase-targeting subunit [Aphelenchoides fujianensis]|nr:Hsp90 chaperone protein kinase-targeting subunit [Aphelenchoides fujianensis]
MLIMNGTMNSEAPPDPPSFAMWNAVVTGIASFDGELEKCTDQTARIKLELEKADIKKQEEDFLRKEKELADKERLAPWNVDTIGKEAWSKSIVNKVTDKKPAPPPKNEDEESDRMMKYFKDNETLLDKYARLKGFDQCEKFLLEHPHLCSEFATSYLTIEALNLAIDEKESPGGLDPQEVFESLPESMQEAFTSQSVEKLQDIATTMDSEVFQYHLNRCIASGPWVPNAKDAEEDAQSSSKA